MNQPLLEVLSIRKSYKKITALKGVSLNLFQGEVFCLLGVNGAGKSTLSSIIATLHPPTSGDVLYQGSSIFKNIPNYRKSIGYCPQSPNLNPLLTMQENLYLAGKYYGMSNAAIEKRIKELHKSLGIGEYLEHKTSELSGGWKQRYMIARTLIHEPTLVILDEPTVGLDPAIRHQLWYYINHVASNGITILLTTHYLDEAEELADRICILDKGEVKLIDTVEQLKTSFKKERLEDIFLQLTNQKE